MKGEIERLIEKFDYDSVTRVMGALNWKWYESDHIPTVANMKGCVRSLFEDIGDSTSLASGGFQVSKWNDEEGKAIYQIQFIAASLSSYEVEP